MARVRWGDLDWVTRERLRAIGLINGCGNKAWAFEAPSWLYHASCDQHDFNYWLGGDAAARAKADAQFYAAMVLDAKKTPWWNPVRYARLARARTYYWLVRAFGAHAFHYGEERTLEDLLKILEGSGA